MNQKGSKEPGFSVTLTKDPPALAVVTIFLDFPSLQMWQVDVSKALKGRLLREVFFCPEMARVRN